MLPRVYPLIKSWVFIFLVLIIFSGCLGTSVLKRGTEDGKKIRETPSLHTVPARPTKVSTSAREALTQEMQEDYEKVSHDLAAPRS